MSQTIQQLQQRYNNLSFARIEQGPNGFPRVAIHSRQADALVYLHGAHVAEFRPAGFSEILYMSPGSHFLPNKPIRGGVPTIFPWFGPRAADPTSPIHGFARLTTWNIESLKQLPSGEVELVLSISDTPETREIWNHSFVLSYRILVGDALTMGLTVKNTSAAAFSFEEALHTYFTISDIRNIVVEGLDNAAYLDRADNRARKTQEPGGIRFVGETDRSYLSTTTCVIHDPLAKREIVVEKSGSGTTVVWNPFPPKARTLADLGEGQWPAFVCIETANAAESAVTLEPGASHVMTQNVFARAIA